MLLLLVLPALAYAQENRVYAPDRLSVVTAEGRDLVVLTTEMAGSSTVQLTSGGFAARSFETTTRRIHVVEFKGETYRAATPLTGSRSLIAFDPARRTFASLLPSIRVETNERAKLDLIADVLGTDRIKVFKALGFAIVDLPPNMHPADAIVRIQNLPRPPNVAVRLRGPRIKWN